MMRRLSVEADGIKAGVRTWLPSHDSGAAGGGREPEVQAEAYRKAYLEGFDAGFADGDKDARRALEEATERARIAEEVAKTERERWCAGLEKLTARFAEIEADQWTQMEAMAVSVAYAAMCRLIGQLHTEQALVGALCRETLESMHLEPTQLCVAKADLPSLEKVGLALPAKVGPGLEAGDCIIETSLGSVDAGVETQLRALLQALLETLGRKGSRP